MTLLTGDKSKRSTAPKAGEILFYLRGYVIST